MIRTDGGSIDPPFFFGARDRAAVAALAFPGVAAASVIRQGRGADATTVFALAAIAAYVGPFVIVDYFDRYVVAFSPVPGYPEVQTWPVSRRLPRSPKEVKLLRREP